MKKALLWLLLVGTLLLTPSCPWACLLAILFGVCLDEDEEE